MVLERIQEDVIHDLVEYMIPVTQTYFSVIIDEFFYISNRFLYQIYYKHLDLYKHYRSHMNFDSMYRYTEIEIYFINYYELKTIKEKLKNRQYNGMDIHPKLVEKFIEREDIGVGFSSNTSDLAIDYLLKNEIYWNYFLENTNSRAIEYTIQNWDDVTNEYRYLFSSNHSKKAVDWLINNPQFICNDNIKYNSFNWEYNRLKYVGSKRFLVKWIQENPYLYHKCKVNP